MAGPLPSDKNKSIHAAYQQGLAAYETGSYDHAILLLTPLAEQNNLPGTLARFYLGQSHLKYGLTLLQAGRFAAAANHLALARQINPDSGDLGGYLAHCHAALRQYDMAVIELERHQASGHGDDALPIRLAHAQARDGQLHHAVETLRNAIAAAPHRADLHSHLAALHASIDDYVAARPCYEEAVRLDPANPGIARDLALACAALGDNQAAVTWLAAAQRLAPYDAHIAWLLALGRSAIGDDAHVDVAWPAGTASTLANPALEALGDVIVREPDFVEAFLNLPASSVDDEIFAALTAILERALEHHPDYADLHHHCAKAYERIGRTDRAIEKAADALRVNPQYVQALITLGRLYAQTDRNDDAQARLEEAIRAGGDYPDVHHLLGDLHRRAGRRSEAVSAYRRALQLNSNYAAARDALACLVEA